MPVSCHCLSQFRRLGGTLEVDHRINHNVVSDGEARAK